MTLKPVITAFLGVAHYLMCLFVILTTPRNHYKALDTSNTNNACRGGILFDRIYVNDMDI